MATEDSFSRYAALQLSQGRVFSYIARGQSMRPWIPDGSTVVIGPMDTPCVGDVVLAITPRGPILHRLLKVTAHEATLAGDLNAAIQHVPVEQLKGVALECTLRNGKTRYLRNPLLNRLTLLAFYPVRLRKQAKISLSSSGGPD